MTRIVASGVAKHFRSLNLLLTLPFLGVTALGQLVPHHATLAGMAPQNRQFFAESMRLGDGEWAESSNGLRHALEVPEAMAHAHFSVRESAWYVFGLLTRDGTGDRRRAVAIVDAILSQQYLNPKDKWYGTFRRGPDEPAPPLNARAFQEYDPNWREFVGCTFAMMLIEYPDRLPSTLKDRMQSAIAIAVKGEMAQRRLEPSYTNIALMYGFLLDFAATQTGNTAWRLAADRWLSSVTELFDLHKSFNEYNSPTYYGVDLFGLALLRSYGSTAQIRASGRAMEAAVWSDIAAFYSPRLHNISGPYDRAYGMDMESYVTLVGVWLRTQLGADAAPLPVIVPATNHVGDAWFAAQFIVLGAEIPPVALGAFKTLPAPHLVQRQIDDRRSASAWVADDILFGGESASGTKDADANAGQYAAATMQWRLPSGQIGWMRMIHGSSVDVTATKEGLTIASAGAITLQLFAPGVDVSTAIHANEWRLPGLLVTSRGEGRNFSLAPDVGATSDITYGPGKAPLTLQFQTQVQP